MRQLETIETVDDLLQIIDTKELLEKAQKLGAFPVTAATAGNTISLFAMLILQRILCQQAAVNPISNITTIVSITNAIATLNADLRIVPTQ